MTGLKTAIVLYNKVHADSPEDVKDGLTQANWIAELVSEFGYSVIKLQFKPDTIGYLDSLREKLDFFVVNLVDSAPGEENLAYLVPALLDYAKIKYTGCTHESLFITTNKVYAKKRLRELGIGTPEFVYGDGISEYCEGRKYIIKALTEDASIGLDEHSVVLPASLDELKNAVSERERHTGKVFFAERFIDGREFNVCVYGDYHKPIVLPPHEWIFEGFDERGKEKIFNYDAKWTESSYDYNHISQVYSFNEADSKLIEELKDIARTCWEGFGLTGYARIDFRIDSEKKPWVLEVNCNPSFYGFYHSAKNNGMDFADILKQIVILAEGGSNVGL